MSSAQQIRLFYCPGEDHPVSFAVHLSRLAAAFPKCRDCPLQSQRGHLQWDAVVSLDEAGAAPPRRPRVTRQGVRGVYLNELTRRDAGDFAARFVASLSPPQQGSLSVVVGFQEHSAAPDLLVGVVNALRRCGVQMVEIGMSTPPAFSFAVRQLSADAGILITNSGGTRSEIGLDFAISEGLPLRDRSVLEGIASGRIPTDDRRAAAPGGYRTFLNQTEYERSLSPWFHALRPLRLVLATPLRLVREVAARRFEELACALETVPLAERRRDLRDPGDPDLVRLADRVRESQADLGFLIDDDGRRAAVVDEQGVSVKVADWARLLSQRNDPGTLDFVDDDGEVWFAGRAPQSDGLLTLAQLLQALSRSDAPLSERTQELTAPTGAAVSVSSPDLPEFSHVTRSTAPRSGTA